MLKSTPCKDKSKHTKICGEYSKSVGYNYNSKRAGGIILNKNLDKILLVLNRESVNKNNPKWGLPKGHLKKGENSIVTNIVQLNDNDTILVTLENDPQILVLDEATNSLDKHHTFFSGLLAKTMAVCKIQDPTAP